MVREVDNFYELRSWESGTLRNVGGARAHRHACRFTETLRLHSHRCCTLVLNQSLSSCHQGDAGENCFSFGYVYINYGNILIIRRMQKLK